MAPKRDYYEILGVDRNAAPQEIKRAFRRLARRHHPDVNPDDPDAEARFKEVAEAYEVLGDANRRTHYDHYGHAAPSGGLSGDFWSDFGGVGDLFDAFFGGRPAGGRTRPRRGADLRYDLEIGLKEVAAGLERSVTIRRLQTCGDCDGTGSRSGTGDRTCSVCHGVGQTQQTTATPFGRLSTVTTCHACRGEGRVVADPCQSCGGRGLKVGEAQVTVRIPAGVEDGVSLRIEGEGEGGERNAPAGDLYVVIHVKPHEIFDRRGRDLYCEAPIPFTVAALGGSIAVPTLDGSDEVAVPAGTQTGEAFTVRGKGLPDIRTGVRGALHVRVRVVTPTKLSERQREILSEFAREGGDEIDDQKGWFERVRDALRGEE